jgi:hypothetical protein
MPSTSALTRSPEAHSLSIKSSSQSTTSSNFPPYHDVLAVLQGTLSLVAAAGGAFIIAHYDPLHGQIFDPSAQQPQAQMNDLESQGFLDLEGWVCDWRKLQRALRTLLLSLFSDNVEVSIFFLA